MGTGLGIEEVASFDRFDDQENFCLKLAATSLESMGGKSKPTHAVHAAQLAAPSTSLLQGVARQVGFERTSTQGKFFGSDKPGFAFYTYLITSTRDDLHRRPSLMSNFFPPHIGYQQGYSREDNNHLHVDTSGSLLGMKIDPSPGAGTTLTERENDELSEKKATSDRLELIEKDRKQADQQVEILTKRRERLKNIKKESEQEVKDVSNGEVDERENVPLWQRIIAENKRKSPVKARLATKKPAQDFFYEPVNAPGVSDLLKRQKTFGLKLREAIAYRQRVKLGCFRYNDDVYNSCMKDFLKKIERWENSPKKIARDLKNREIFERAFPEMKRTREEKERSCRNDRISLRVQEAVEDLPAPSERGQVDEEHKMRNAAAIPPLLVDESTIRAHLFDNKHGIIKNAADENKKWIESFLASWSDDEKKLFKERLSAVGKNYANIAMFLENKTVKDCVLFYYLCKKRENFKAVIPKRKRKLAKTYKPPLMPTPEELAMYQLLPQDALTETQCAFFDYEFTNRHESFSHLLSACASNDSKCVMCQLRINPATNPGRVLTRSNYELYGIDAKRQGADCKICTKCKDEVLKIRNSGRCMVKMCASGKRKVKATKTMPTKWRQMDDRQRTFILAHLSIPREIVKCCGPCFKRISKKLDLLFAGDLEEEMAKFELEVHQTWQSGEISRLQNLVAQFGTDWCSVSAQMHGRSADDCRLQYESLSKKEDEEEEDFEEEADGDKCERQDDDVPMEEDTQDCPETSILTARDDDMDTDIVELPTTSQESTLRSSPIDRNTKDDSQTLVEHTSTYADIGKGSITAGTPLRPPSVSIIEQQPTISQLNAAAATAASQPSTTPSVLTGFDQNTLLQIHALFGGGDETRTRAILDQFQQQRNYQFQQQFIQQQPLLDQLFLTYSQFSDADLNRIYLAADVTTRCVIEAILQHKKQAVNLQMRQQHAAMVSQIQAKQLELRQMEQQREEQRLQQEKQRQIDATKRRLQEQIKHHDITAANIEKNKAAMVNRVGEINQSLQTASLTQLQRQQLLLEYSSQSAKCSSLQSMAQNHRMQRTQLQSQLDALNTGNGSAAVVASMSLSSSPVIYRMHDTSVQMDDEQRLREEIEKIDEDIRGMEKQVRRLEEDERTYQKKKIVSNVSLSIYSMVTLSDYTLLPSLSDSLSNGSGIFHYQAEQMITSAFRINSTVQDFQAKQDLKEAQDNMRVAEHSRLTFQKKLDNLRESRELLVRQQRMLLNSSNTSGVIVGSSGAVSKGAVKDFGQQQSVKAVQPPTTISLAAQHYQLQMQQQQQQQPQQQQQQQKTPIGIRQPTADSKPLSPSLSTATPSTASTHIQQSLTSCSPAGSSTAQPKASPNVSSSIAQPLASPVSNTSGVFTPIVSFQDTNVPAACTLPPPALQFLATSNVSGPLTYEPISPDDNAPKSPFTRAEAPSSTPALSGGSRMFSALDFDFPLAVAPTVITPTPNPPSLAPPLAELLRAAGSDAITTAMTFEPLSDDDD
ncbi:unnamed protein product [Angiostrongylus costaricensis]|uniref:SANT domain-containing protein n=1 Tax=Angiostrongylus costaricensis TaxID=334426 RepID=A0A158PFY6_ANGCS|nr:unnamed protein product [Angiostrongylus costaricensis]